MELLALVQLLRQHYPARLRKASLDPLLGDTCEANVVQFVEACLAHVVSGDVPTDSPPVDELLRNVSKLPQRKVLSLPTFAGQHMAHVSRDQDARLQRLDRCVILLARLVCFVCVLCVCVLCVCVCVFCVCLARLVVK